MSDVARIILYLATVGALVTFVGSFVRWYRDEPRRLTRALTRVLKGKPEALLFAPGRGRAVGVNFPAGTLGVAWDSGGWCLVYRLDELMGAELMVDGQVAARAFRGEGRRALERRTAEAGEVVLRLIFDDAQHPDFDLELWLPGDAERRPKDTPADAIADANQWLARAEAILRRPGRNPQPAAAPAGNAPHVQTPPSTAAPAPLPPPPPPKRAPRERPPWEDDDDDQPELFGERDN